MFPARLAILATAAAISGMAAVAHPQPIAPNPAVLVTEHVDINVLFSSGQWDVQLLDDDNFVSYPAGQAVIHVDRASLTPRSTNPAFSFIGVPENTPFYRITASQTPGQIYLGYAAYGVPQNAIDLYNANAESGGRVNGNGRWVRLQLHSVEGPGHYSVWANSLGGPVRFHSTAQHGTAPAETNTLWLVAGGHSHFNYGFTAPGLYRVNYLPAAYLNDNNAAILGPNSQASQPISVFFNVDPGYPVSRVTPSGTLPQLGNIRFLGGYRQIDVGGAVRGSVRVGEIFPSRTYILLDLVNPDDTAALRLALRGFPEGPDYDLPPVPPTAIVDDTVLAAYPGFDLALRFDSLPASTFDFEFDYSMILGGVGIQNIGILGTTIAVPEPTGAAGLILAAAILCRRRGRHPS